MTQTKNNKIYYVYAHYTLDTNELFYIGMGKHDRAEWKYNRNNYWHKIVNKHGRSIQYLYENLTQEEAWNLEIECIAKFKPKCNFTKGGGHADPFTLLPEEQKQEILKKRSISLKGKNRQPKSSEHKEKLKCAWRSKPIICKDNNTIFVSIEECRRQLNLGNLNISRQIKNGWKCKGYTLDFYEPN